ncbi:MAG: hypothetical protein HOP07_18970 [Bacteriovoracaceae bacterium]|nr:hypothetical protein [Bacteriovoracaceae bacterium]
MIRNAIILGIFFFAQALFADETVRLRTDIDLAVTAVIGTDVLSLNVENPSGAKPTDTAPAKLYLPMQNTPNQSHKFFITSTASVFNSVNLAHIASIPLRINTPATTQRYLYAAVKDTTNSNAYKVIKKYTDTTLSIGAESDVAFSFSPADICLRIPTECTSFLAAEDTKAIKTFTVYFFLSDQSAYGPTSTIVPTTAPLNNGIYFSMLMSNQVYEETELIIMINKVRIGDNRLILEYTTNLGSLDAVYAKSTRVFKHSSAPAIVNDPIKDYAGALTTKEYPYALNSELIVSDLANNSYVFLSVAFVDKFNFVTNLSDDITESPLDIEELLKKQGCFLLTAGFGEEHYVIQFFRNFRDATLSKSYLGKMFINFYYETAPKYALEIYHSPSLRFMIRSMAYVAYAVFNYYWLIFGFLALAILRILLRQKLHKN